VRDTTAFIYNLRCPKNLTTSEINVLKSIACGKLREEHSGQVVTLAGWVHRRRDHGNLIFIDLRDREGLVQVIFNPEKAPNAHKIVEDVRNEWVLQVTGQVETRPEGTANHELPTGYVEVTAKTAVVLSKSKTPPFYVNEADDVDELVRLKYRYLDLRRPQMRDMVILRHKVVKFIRDYLDKRDFLEVETPILIKSTPEGARDFLVPSRLYPGKFYALPQSPQQLKQLLMAAGVEKYFQIARCFRDEDPRADRVVEHTQLDLEMSFVEEEDILSLVEDLYTDLVRSIVPEKTVMKPFPRLTYADSMERYGTEKPDLRFGLEMSDISDISNQTEFKVFKAAISNGGIVKAFSAPNCGDYSRRQLDALVDLAKQGGAQGLVWIALKGDQDSLETLAEKQVNSPIRRYATLDQIKAISKTVGAQVGDLVLIVAGPITATNVALSLLRTEMGKRLELADPNVLHFAFVVDFPLFEWSDTDGRWDAAHHAFTMPKAEYVGNLESDPGNVIAECYDLVCNGLECASGSIRIHTRELQERVLKVLGYTRDEIEQRFGQLLTAFDYGTPPHGGIAPGLDRLLMLLMDTDNIRDVIVFPKTQSAIDPLFNAPDFVEEEQLNDLRIKVDDGGK
jgi:aspartyl-tRNA synthetase